MVVPACCIAWIVIRDSLYFLDIFLVRKVKIQICRLGREKVMNEDESGERVMHVGTDFD